MDNFISVRPTGLIKETDTVSQIQYSFLHSNTSPYFCKSLLLIVVFIVDQQVIRHLHIYYRVALWVLYLVFNNLIIISKQETIRIIKGIGMELIQTTGLLIPSTTHEFIPSNKIVDVVILEGFKGLQVVYYLACIVEDASKLSLILHDSNIRMSDLIRIRHDLRQRL